MIITKFELKISILITNKKKLKFFKYPLLEQEKGKRERGVDRKILVYR